MDSPSSSLMWYGFGELVSINQRKKDGISANYVPSYPSCQEVSINKYLAGCSIPFSTTCSSRCIYSWNMLKSNSSPTIIRNKENSKKMPSNSQQFTSCSEAYPADTLAQSVGLRKVWVWDVVDVSLGWRCWELEISNKWRQTVKIMIHDSMMFIFFACLCFGHGAEGHCEHVTFQNMSNCNLPLEGLLHA